MMSPQQKRKLTLAIHGYGRARMNYGKSLGGAVLEINWKLADKLVRRADKAKAHLVAVVDDLMGGKP